MSGGHRSIDELSQATLSRQSSVDKYEPEAPKMTRRASNTPSEAYSADFAGSEDSGDSSQCFSPTWGAAPRIPGVPEAPMDISLRVRRGADGHQDINFTFDPESDTFLAVATELVATLGYPDSEVVRFATKIESCVHRTQAKRALSAISQVQTSRPQMLARRSSEPGLDAAAAADLVSKQHRALAEKHHNRMSGLMAKQRPARVPELPEQQDDCLLAPLGARRSVSFKMPKRNSIDTSDTNTKMSFCKIRGMNMPDVIKLKRCPSGSGRHSDPMQFEAEVAMATV